MKASRAAELLILAYDDLREALRHIRGAVALSDPIHREYVLVRHIEEITAKALKETPELLPEPSSPEDVFGILKGYEVDTDIT